MKTIIAGSRDITAFEILDQVMGYAYQEGIIVTEVVSGGARGVDQLGEQWAKKMNQPLKIFPADWKTHGKVAGFIRNGEMAKYADALVAIWDGESKGTKHMITTAAKEGLKLFVYRTDR